IVAERHISTHACKALCRAGRMVANINRIMDTVTLAHDGDNMAAAKNMLTLEFREAMKGAIFDTSEMSYLDVINTLLTDPRKIRFILATSLRGDYLDSMMTTLSGRGTTIPVGCVGPKKGIFRPDHGPMNDLVGLNRVNPTAAILAGAAMLDYLGHKIEGNRIRSSLMTAYKNGYRTADMGGTMGTYEFTDHIISLCNEP
ncbi:MAG: isocitrate/isopropylmalate family dehydrogenase, partial [Methanomassiliicoccaceae archaeon]|nr:isocitrate/isopropylmalate family dehydrogenase [Methanomassiliicoccaceae archaeon]